ncbi:MAG: CvpA family protein [Candidatus Omnitrophica bacterium]|nr:CvpA family protein [Candidatus Omnitrophota bacterium]
MNTFTHILESINWVDVVMLVLLIRSVFIGVKTGFVIELFKFLGVLGAVLVGLHYYALMAALIAKKTNWSLESFEFVIFVLLCLLAVLVVKCLRDWFLMFFKFESTHAGFNQWGAGFICVLRALFLASLIMYALLLTRVEYLQRETLTSISQKLALKVAPNTYHFLFHQVIGKIFTQQKFNEDVFNVISRNSVSRKPF